VESIQVESAVPEKSAEISIDGSLPLLDANLESKLKIVIAITIKKLY